MKLTKVRLVIKQIMHEAVDTSVGPWT